MEYHPRPTFRLQTRLPAVPLSPILPPLISLFKCCTHPMHNLVLAHLVGFILFLPNVIVDRLTVLGIDISYQPLLESQNYTYQCGIGVHPMDPLPVHSFCHRGTETARVFIFMLHFITLPTASIAYNSSLHCFLTDIFHPASYGR
jgi:hypothetical protein